MTQITVLDGHTMNPGDLDWAPLEALGELQLYPRTSADQVIDRCTGCDAIITNKVALDSHTLAALPDLKYIGVTATGVNVVDLDACRERGITVTNVPAYSTQSVAQMTFALLLELTSNVGQHSHVIRDHGKWAEARDFCFWDAPLTELNGLTMGLIGYGSIGRIVARIAQSFGMNVLAYRRRTTEPADEGIRYVLLKKLLQSSDVISLHCPLTVETNCLIDARQLALMKPGAILLNTSRGALLDEVAVAEALRNGQLGGCGVDVLSTEPPNADNPLLGAPHCIVSPHVAWATGAARQRLLDATVANLAAFQKGSPQNVVQ